MTRVLFDTNIILDVFLERKPHYENAAKLFSLIDSGSVIGCITATTITDIYFISRKEKGHESSVNFLCDMINLIEVVGVDKQTILSALSSETTDFEDAIQEVAATNNQIETIITRNKKDFKGRR